MEFKLSVFWGNLIKLSQTSVIFKILHERRIINSNHFLIFAMTTTNLLMNKLSQAFREIKINFQAKFLLNTGNLMCNLICLYLLCLYLLRLQYWGNRDQKIPIEILMLSKYGYFVMLMLL